MSHELRTPLNAMLGFAQLLELEELDDPSTEYVDQISRGRRPPALALINEVLDIARIESDHVHLELEPVMRARRLAGGARPHRAARGPGRCAPATAPSTPTTSSSSADRQRLLQVLLNLVSNAIKYNHEGGRVEVGVARPATGSCLIVHDTGPGLAEEQVERLFVPFERLGYEHSDIEGSGVGLALSRGLTERMGGVLSVSTSPGSGSAFCVDLPAAVATGAAPTSPSHPSLTGGRP